MKKIDIKDKVFSFYAEAKNKNSCDECYTMAEDVDIDKLYEDVECEAEKNSLLSQAGIIVLTANKYEKNILHKEINNAGVSIIKRIKIDLKTSCERFNVAYAYYFTLHQYSILHIHAGVTGSYTIGGSADVVRWIINNDYLYPSVIISFGISFGTKEGECELGDVVISEKIYPYLVGLKINGEKIDVVDDNSFRIDSTLRLKIKSLKDNNKFNSLPFKVYFKNYITGEAVMSSNKWRQKATRITTQEIFAGEMEAYGVFKECSSNNFNIPCFVLKSICDWGTEKNFKANDPETLSLYKEKLNITSDDEAKIMLSKLKDSIQAFAADCAYKTFEVMLKNAIFEVSLFENMKQKMRDYNGESTTCDEFKKILDALVEETNMGYRVSQEYAHRCLMVMHEKGIVECEEKCLNVQNTDSCYDDVQDAWVHIKNEV